ncbi:DUF3288 family protein [Cyanobacterium stanieri LEGE 03274]|uniref:DUF3288 family protein n=1 Tax=Cyanobacterium stanieri LEGE 03274 TaxID=1828756 RepID=A0ABR9V1S7_9CHRO|nr:DUF3288 family protein [Cyanobacterium stanieri]MBE9221849.1 DUF3288 family protein [Cyanobacterium stanieri LEGE 03274]
MIQDQQHPQAHIDRVIIQKIFVEGKTDYHMAEVARLRIRYHNFPGARDIQRDLDVILQQWDITEEQLFSHVRTLHAQGKIYGKKQTGNEQEDWS